MCSILSVEDTGLSLTRHGVLMTLTCSAAAEDNFLKDTEALHLSSLRPPTQQDSTQTHNHK